MAVVLRQWWAVGEGGENHLHAVHLHVDYLCSTVCVFSGNAPNRYFASWASVGTIKGISLYFVNLTSTLERQHKGHFIVHQRGHIVFLLILISGLEEDHKVSARAALS